MPIKLHLLPFEAVPVVMRQPRPGSRPNPRCLPFFCRWPRLRTTSST